MLLGNKLVNIEKMCSQHVSKIYVCDTTLTK